MGNAYKCERRKGNPLKEKGQCERAFQKSGMKIKAPLCLGKRRPKRPRTMKQTLCTFRWPLVTFGRRKEKNGLTLSLQGRQEVKTREESTQKAKGLISLEGHKDGEGKIWGIFQWPQINLMNILGRGKSPQIQTCTCAIHRVQVSVKHSVNGFVTTESVDMPLQLTGMSLGLPSVQLISRTWRH